MIIVHQAEKFGKSGMIPLWQLPCLSSWDGFDRQEPLVAGRPKERTSGKP